MVWPLAGLWGWWAMRWAALRADSRGHERAGRWAPKRVVSSVATTAVESAGAMVGLWECGMAGPMAVCLAVARAVQLAGWMAGS